MLFVLLAPAQSMLHSWHAAHADCASIDGSCTIGLRAHTVRPESGIRPWFWSAWLLMIGPDAGVLVVHMSDIRIRNSVLLKADGPKPCRKSRAHSDEADSAYGNAAIVIAAINACNLC